MSEEELRAFARSASPPTSTRGVWFVDELPKGPTGKILKREINAHRRADPNRLPRNTPARAEFRRPR